MKIYLANASKQNLGGGWTFLRNLQIALKDQVEFVDSTDECDIYFISGATMVTREDVQSAKDQGKKIIIEDRGPVT